MPRKRYIDWRISEEQAEVNPLGFRVTLSSDRDGSVVSSIHNTFERTGEFQYSPNYEVNLASYPMNGLASPVPGGLVRFSLNGEQPLRNLIVTKSGGIAAIGTGGMLARSRGMPGIEVSSIFTDVRTDEAWVLDRNGGVYVLDRNLETSRAFRVDPLTIAVIPDGARSKFWQVEPDRVRLRSKDMSVLIDVRLTYTISRIESALVMPVSGDLVLSTESVGAALLWIGRDGWFDELDAVVTGISPWSTTSVLVCHASYVLSEYDGHSAPTPIYDLSLSGVIAHRADSDISGNFYVLDRSAKTVNKVERVSGNILWSKQAPATDDPDELDLSAWFDTEEKGRPIMVWSSDFAGSIRDMISEGHYGRTVELENSSSPRAVRLKGYSPAHVWTRIDPVSNADFAAMESSSSESSSSSSSWSTNSVSSSSSSPSSSKSSSRSTTSESESSMSSSYSTLSSYSSVSSSSSSSTLSTSSMHSSSSESSESSSCSHLNWPEITNSMVSSSGYLTPHYPWLVFDRVWETCATPTATDHAWIKSYEVKTGPSIDEWMQIDFRTPTKIMEYRIDAFGARRHPEMYLSSSSSDGFTDITEEESSGIYRTKRKYEPAYEISPFTIASIEHGWGVNDQHFDGNIAYKMGLDTNGLPWWCTAPVPIGDNYFVYVRIRAVLRPDAPLDFYQCPYPYIYIPEALYYESLLGQPPPPSSSLQPGIYYLPPGVSDAILLTLQSDATKYAPYRMMGFHYNPGEAPPGEETISQKTLSFMYGAEYEIKLGIRTFRTLGDDCGDFSHSPTDWTLQGSNNGSTWAILDSQSGVSYNYSYDKTWNDNGLTKFCRVQASKQAYYRFYKFVFTRKGASSNHFGIAQIGLGVE